MSHGDSLASERDSAVILISAGSQIPVDGLRAALWKTRISLHERESAGPLFFIHWNHRISPGEGDLLGLDKKYCVCAAFLLK